jgi:hypothetical protein
MTNELSTRKMEIGRTAATTLTDENRTTPSRGQPGRLRVPVRRGADPASTAPPVAVNHAHRGQG